MSDNVQSAQPPSTNRAPRENQAVPQRRLTGRPSRIRAAMEGAALGVRARWSQPVPGLANTPGTRLARLRLHSGHASAADAARAMGANLTTYQQHEHGTRNVSGRAAIRYGTFFGVAPSLILYGEPAAPADSRRVAVVGVVGLHGKVRPRMSHKSPSDFADSALGVPETVAAPPGAEDGLQSLVVLEDDLAPAYRSGDLVFFAPPGPPDALATDGRECVVEKANGDRLLCLCEREADGSWTLRSYRGRPVRGVRLRSAAPVLWVQRAAVPAISHQRNARLAALT